MKSKLFFNKLHPVNQLFLLIKGTLMQLLCLHIFGLLGKKKINLTADIMEAFLGFSTQNGWKRAHQKSSTSLHSLFTEF